MSISTEDFIDTKEFKARYKISASTQALWRRKGMPHYSVPNAKKILYKISEIDAWLKAV